MKGEYNSHSITEKRSRASIEEQWNRERQRPFPLPFLQYYWDSLLVDRCNAPTPEPSFVVELKGIDPSLSVHWIGRYQRWGLFKEVPAVLWFEYQGKIVIVQDKFPLMFDVLQHEKTNAFMPLDKRGLPVINWNNKSVFDDFIKRRDKTEKLMRYYYTEGYKNAFHGAEKELRQRLKETVQIPVNYVHEKDKDAEAIYQSDGFGNGKIIHPKTDDNIVFVK